MKFDMMALDERFSVMGRNYNIFCDILIVYDEPAEGMGKGAQEGFC